MRRWLPERWLISVVCGPLAVLAAVVMVDWSQWASAVALVLPALLLAWGGAAAHVLGSYLLSVAITAFAFALSAFSRHSPIAGVPLPVVVAPIVCALAAIWSQLFLGGRARRWALTMGATVAAVCGLLLFSVAAAPAAGDWRKAPELLASVPTCSDTCVPYATPGGHKRCNRVVHTERVLAVRECDLGSGMLSVTAEGHETSVLVSPGDPVMIWREQGGKLFIEQSGMPLRAISTEGAVMLTLSLGGRAPAVPAVTLQVVGASLLMVGLALVVVLRSLRAQRRLSGGLVGHVEAGRFFPRDGHLTPLAVAGAHINGPALLFGAARRASYRDGGGGAVRVLSGTLGELVVSHHGRRFRACALALCAVLFAWLGVAADLARLH